MAYNKKKVFADAKKAIKEHSLYFVEDICAFIGISKPTFYDFFKVDSDEFNELKGMLASNKIKTKVEIRKKLQQGEKAAELIALYKLLASNDERKALSMQHIDHTTDGKQININPIAFTESNKDK